MVEDQLLCCAVVVDDEFGVWVILPEECFYGLRDTWVGDAVVGGHEADDFGSRLHCVT